MKKNFTEKLQIDEQGNIWKGDRQLKTSIDKYGNVVYKTRQTTYSVAKLVAKNFVDNPKNKKKILFLDGNKLNVNADNLKWVSLIEKNPEVLKKDLYKHKKTYADKRYTDAENIITQAIIKYSKREKKMPNLKSLARITKFSQSFILKTIREKNIEWK